MITTAAACAANAPAPATSQPRRRAGCRIAPIAETPTSGYDDLRAEVSYKWKPAKPRPDELSEVTVGINGSNLLNRDIRNSVSYSKDEVLMPGASVRLFASVKY